MSSKNPLNNASEIIERFGGIRPMAAKIDTPVTTVQGWKKRNVIPGTRRDQIMTAAADNNIDLSDLMNGSSIANQNEVKEVKAPAKAEKKLPRPASSSKSEAKRSEPKTPTSAPTSSVPQNTKPQSEQVAPPKIASSQDEIFAAIEANNRKTLARSTWIACVLILLAGLAAFVLLNPTLEENVQDMKTKAAEQSSMIEQQSQELEALKEQMDERTSFIENMMPDGIQAGLQEQMDGLQTQARNIQNTVDQLSERAGEISSEISSSVLGPDAGPLSQRLEMLEEKMAAFSAAGNFGDVVERIGNLEGSLLGQEQLRESVAELQNMVGNQANGTLDENLAEAQSSEDGGALSQTLEGVSGNDLKAAAMLIAFSQLRDSLNREAPFENDLALLERLVDEDNTELQGAIDRLAPHADGGVLTASGLSGTFKGLSSDILESSLKGEDISFKEKAKARFSSLLKIEKEGELVNGTETQVSVSKAQKLLDEGNIEGAIAELQTLEGDAALTAQPFIERAEVSLMAEKVQQMLGENILSRISSQIPVQIPGADMLQGEEGAERSFSDLVPDLENPSNLNMDDVKRTLEEAVPNLGEPEVIRDEESGVTILPNQSGFKGFSGGQ